MNCKDVQPLLDGYVDAEVDLVRSMEVERHLDDCGSCLQALKSRREVKEAIRAASLRFDPPRGLEKRMLAAARAEARKSAAGNGVYWRRFAGFASPTFAVTVIVIGAVLAWSAMRPLSGLRGQDSLAEEIVSDHVRSLMASHLFDVASTDQHTVKPWFTGRLDYSPPVVDLTDEGFPLTGGRLDYVQGRPVAALVYRHRKHVINLFVWPAPAAQKDFGSDPITESLRGFHTVHWSKAGMTYHAVSDVNSSDLVEFARDIERRSGP